jgi:site-specific DNA-methyltransferase (adenine-specific)
VAERSLSLFAPPPPLTDDQAWRVEKRDAVELLRSLPDESVDLLITDPPYESLEKHRAKGTTTRLKHSKSSSNDWFSIFPNARFPELFAECHRVLKKNAHFYLFCDAETMFAAKPLGEAAGFKFWSPIVWDKIALGMGYHYRRRCEFILFFEKGKRKLRDLGVPDVLRFKRIRGSGAYPTQKPRELIDVLVTQSSSVGELVLDPFMGSGVTGLAALGLHRRFLGSDIADASVTFAGALLEACAPGGRWPVDDEGPERPPDETGPEPPVGWKPQPGEPVVIIAETSHDLVSERLRALTRRLQESGEDTAGGFLGGRDGYGADFENDTFTMRQHTEDPADCTCGACDVGGDGKCARDCPFNLPQFKCGDFEVRWHKWIGRSLEVSAAEMSEADISEMFDRCERSLKP